jgi:phosphoribosyl 1,2-cyclic phosphodiesterase
VKVYFWGTRGSLPASVTAEEVRAKMFRAIKKSKDHSFNNDEEIEKFIEKDLPFSIRGSYGTNTSCVEIMGGKEYILCDGGTGLRDFGNHALKSSSKGEPNQKNIFNIFISHLHWDHIQGFPFFTPAYIEGNSVNIYGCHNELEQAFINQQNYPYFPVPLKYMKADIRFITLESGKEYEIAGFKVKVMKQNHPGDSYGYRFEKDRKSIVYSTDSEHKREVDSKDYVFLDFFRDADLLIFDAQYELQEAILAKENWGHSSNVIAVELSVKANVKRLCIFHNEPTFDDEKLDQFLENTRRYLAIHAEESHPLKIDLAYDGLQIEL